MCIKSDFIHKGDAMRTNIDIDDKLMAEAMKATNAKTKKEAVVIALEEVVRRKRQLGILKLLGKIDGDWDIDAWRRD
jgi:Arc/MetJ family transcription regulator